MPARDEYEFGALWHLQTGEAGLLHSLEPEDFSTPYLKKIFIAIRDVGECNPMLVEEKVGDDYNWLNAIVNAPYVGEAKYVLGNLRRMRAEREAQQFRAYGNTDELPEKFSKKGREIHQMLHHTLNPTGDLVAEIQAKPEVYPTGLPSLDFLLNGGIEKGSIFVVAARTGVGKTTLAISLAKNFVAGGHDVCFLSLEMSRKSIAERFLQNFWERSVLDVREYAKDMLSLPAQFLVLEPSYDLPKILGEMESNLESAVFVVDYYQLIQVAGDGRVQQLEEISNRLKQFAFENKKPLIVVAQLNRQIEQEKANREPILSDLRGCGALEQDAHVVTFLWDKSAKENQTVAASLLSQGRPEPEHDYRLLVKKNRNGRLGMVHLNFEPAYMRFTENPAPHTVDF